MDVPLDKLIATFLKIKARRDELQAAFDEQDSALSAQQDRIKAALLDHCKETGSEGARTDAGTFRRSATSRYFTTDWAGFGEFVVAHNAPDLFEKRLHQGNVAQYMQEHPDVVLPGLQADTKYNIIITKPRRGSKDNDD